MRAVCILNLIAIAAFVVLSAIAITMYPGGSWHEPSHQGHHFFYNFMCDLLREKTVAGRSNLRGAPYGTAAMLSLVMGLTLHWFVARRILASHPVVGLLIVVPGVLSAVATMVVSLTPTDRFGHLHTIALTAALVTGTLAATVSILGIARARGTPPWLGRIGLATLVLLLAGSAVFILDSYFGGHHLRLMPVLQRLAAMTGTAYISWSAFFLLQAPARGQLRQTILV